MRKITVITAAILGLLTVPAAALDAVPASGGIQFAQVGPDRGFSSGRTVIIERDRERGMRRGPGFGGRDFGRPGFGRRDFGRPGFAGRQGGSRTVIIRRGGDRGPSTTTIIRR